MFRKKKINNNAKLATVENDALGDDISKEDIPLLIKEFIIATIIIIIIQTIVNFIG